MGNIIDSAKEALNSGGNVIKCRDDRDIVIFDKDGCCKEGNEYSWIEGQNGKVDFKKDTAILRDRIEPWLTALFQSEHLSLLCGSGLSTAISLKSCKKTGASMDKCEFSVFKEEINRNAKIKAGRAGRKDGNIEDQIRTALELLRGLEILGDQRAKSLENDLNKILKSFSESILQTENGIITSKGREEAFDVLINFLLSFASRMGNRERLNIFTTNYDRLIELGAELAGIHLLDRFVGTLMPIFRSSRLNLDLHYNPPGTCWMN